MLALWRYLPAEHSGNVLTFLEKAARQAMEFQGKELVEFFRRVLDFPRRGLLNVRDLDFLELVNHTVASAAGAKLYLAPETFLALRSRTNAGRETTKTLPRRRQTFPTPYQKAIARPITQTSDTRKRWCTAIGKQRRITKRQA